MLDEQATAGRRQRAAGGQGQDEVARGKKGRAVHNIVVAIVDRRGEEERRREGQEGRPRAAACKRPIKVELGLSQVDQCSRRSFYLRDGISATGYSLAADIQVAFSLLIHRIGIKMRFGLVHAP